MSLLVNETKQERNTHASIRRGRNIVSSIHDHRGKGFFMLFT